jgi:thiamine-monophosphate kinase
MADSEFELIARLLERLPPPGPRVRIPSGDDAAVSDHEGPLVISVDALIEGVHFTLPQFPMRAIGRKALAAALSDLAAMGSQPCEAYVVLGVPEGCEGDGLLELADGLADVAERDGVSVVGGDVNRAPALLLSVTAIGAEADGSPLVTRGGAAPGQAVVVTGELGGAAAALSLLDPEAGRPAASLGAEAREAFLARQFDPRPRLAAGRALAAAGATAMIDVSDGLAADAGHLAEAGGVRLQIELERLPLADGLEALRGSEHEARLLAASGGEDYELLACIPADRLAEARAAVEETGCALTEIGEVSAGEGAVIRDANGGEIELPGFDHLR